MAENAALATATRPYPPHIVTPDLVRGPPGCGGTAGGSGVALAAWWTPEHVRGDEVTVASAFL